MNLIRRKRYQLARQCVAWSLLHDGPGLTAIHPSVYNMMVGGQPTGFEIDDVTDYDVFTYISQV